MKDTINIGKLYFDENKFKTHVKKRKKQGLIDNELEYIEKIKEIVLNYNKVFITRDTNKEKFILIKLDNWLLIFDENYRISTCYKLTKFDTIEDMLDEYKKFKKIETYMEVTDENSSYKRIIKGIQDRIRLS